MKSSYAYYPGCLASLSQKELDTSTRAIADKLGMTLVDIPGFTCCGAGDVHEARPEYYLHLNARILGQAEQLGQETLLTRCVTTWCETQPGNASCQTLLGSFQ